MGDKLLGDLFPRLYHLSNLKMHFVYSILPSWDHLSSLSLGFCRHLTDTKAVDMMRFLSILHDSHVSQRRCDSRLWSFDPSRISLAVLLFSCYFSRRCLIMSLLFPLYGR